MTPTRQHLFTLALSAGIPLTASAADSVTLASPDKAVSAKVSIRNKELVYQLQLGGKTVLEDARLGVTVDGTDLGTAVKDLKAGEITEHKETTTSTAMKACSKATTNASPSPPSAMANRWSSSSAPSMAASVSVTSSPAMPPAKSPARQARGNSPPKRKSGSAPTNTAIIPAAPKTRPPAACLSARKLSARC